MQRRKRECVLCGYKYVTYELRVPDRFAKVFVNTVKAIRRAMED